MRRSLNAFLSKIELIALWIVRILFAPDHFGVGFFKRIKYCIHGGFMPDQVANVRPAAQGYKGVPFRT